MVVAARAVSVVVVIDGILRLLDDAQKPPGKDNQDMESQTDSCPMEEKDEDLTDLSLVALKARLFRETDERRRAQCMAKIQSHAVQLTLDLLVREPDPESFFRVLMKALLDQTESQTCGVWLLDEEGTQCSLWMSYIGDQFYSKENWGDLALTRVDMAAHLCAYAPGWSDTIEYTGDDSRLPESVRE